MLPWGSPLLAGEIMDWKLICKSTVVKNRCSLDNRREVHYLGSKYAVFFYQSSYHCLINWAETEQNVGWYKTLIFLFKTQYISLVFRFTLETPLSVCMQYIQSVEVWHSTKQSHLSCILYSLKIKFITSESSYSLLPFFLFPLETEKNLKTC